MRNEQSQKFMNFIEVRKFTVGDDSFILQPFWQQQVHGRPRYDQNVQRQDVNQVYVYDTKTSFYMAKYRYTTFDFGTGWGLISGQRNSWQCPVTPAVSTQEDP